MRKKSYKKRRKNSAIADFILNYYRYILAAILLIIIIVVVVSCTGEGKRKNKVDGTEGLEEATEVLDFTVDFDHDNNASITKLINTYYKAFAAGDVATISTVATPVSENEKNYIKVVSQYYDDIQNVTYYSKNGEYKGTYYVSTTYDIKFTGVDTTAPAMDFFYIETEADGELIINNLYSIYNLTFAENSMDADIYSNIQLYMQQNDFVNLKKDVEGAYAEAILADNDLKKMLKETLDTAIREWAATIIPSTDGEASFEDTEDIDSTEDEGVTPEDTPEDTPGDTAEDTPTDTPADTGTAESVPDDTPTEKVAVTDGVNIRTTASTSGEVLGKVRAGTVLDKIGTDGEWTIVKFEGKKGYVKTEFIGKVPQVVAIDGVNIRKTASTDGELLGKASKGTVLDKLGEKGEWTIVSYKGQKGYVKTEFVSNK